MSKSNDRTLRFYNEVLGLDRLHYGIWQPDDELTYDNLKKAQIRYEDFLIENIPEGVKTVLDVGCGTGVLSKKLLEAGYAVEGLSPDINQKKVFTENVKAEFHHSTFDKFEANKKYDCLIMSESAQYIKLHRLFENARQSLKQDGYLMICDYFRLEDASGIHGKSGHYFHIFKEQMQESGFKLITERDITDSVTKTLDIAKYFADRAILAADIGTEKIRRKHPHLSKFILWLFRNKIDKVNRQMELIDSKAFKQNKTYRFFLLQNIS
ncbi:MAG: class I SAM-dependent methyltransferase [Calditrichaceae bacterium]|nr:class I SAM-dependent methyltransferase [Calditrichaceae bacterium]